ncbi:MAG: AI-2E family transporter [Alphaproteobacteria bacterium]|nr:AI-2E family transporter [Alphaproteobacteria bacterium]
MSSSTPPNSFKNLIFWALPALLAVVFIWLFQGILLPFVIGMVVAYLLNPWVNRLDRKGLSRPQAALMILLSFLAGIGLMMLLTVPVLVREANDLINMAPYYWHKAWDYIGPAIGYIQENGGISSEEDVQGIIQDNAKSAAGVGKGLAGIIAAGGAFLTSMASVLIIAPIAAFFMIKEWPKVVRWARDLIPPGHRDTVIDLATKMDRKIAGFVRGQLLVAVILGVGYATVLFLMGLNYGILIGLAAGFLNLVPLLGSTAGLVIASGVAWIQTGDWQFAGLVALVFIVGQLIEGNFLTPKILGDSVGMHPLWVFLPCWAGHRLPVFRAYCWLFRLPLASVF